MKIEENLNLNKRRQFLIVALENGNIEQAQYDKEMPILERQIQENLSVRIKENSKLINEIKKVKKTVLTDGDLKRNIATILINYLEEYILKNLAKNVVVFIVYVS